MPRKAVLRRENLAARFTSAIDNYADKVAPAFSELMQPLLQTGETMPDAGMVLRLVGRLIVSRFKALLELDRAHIDELGNDVKPRRLKQRLAQALYAKMVDVRRLADAAFDEGDSAELIPIDGKTPGTPRTLYRTGEHAVRRLRDPALKPTNTKLTGIEPQPEMWADELEPLVTELGVALGVLEDARTKAKEKVDDKKKGMTDFDYLYSHGRSIVRGLFFFAKLPDPGKDLPTLNRVRRSRRGPDPRQELPQEPESPAPPAAGVGVRGGAVRRGTVRDGAAGSPRRLRGSRSRVVRAASGHRRPALRGRPLSCVPRRSAGRGAGALRG